MWSDAHKRVNEEEAGGDGVSFGTSEQPIRLRLRDDDGRAVDLLLDRGPIGPEGGNGGREESDGSLAAPTPLAVWQKRLETVERLLKVLEQLPAADPPGDLTGRTLRKLEQVAVRSATAVGNAEEPGVESSRPMM